MRKKIIALVLTAIMLVSVLMVSSVNTEAKVKKPALNKSSISLEVGSKYTLKVKNNKKKITWRTSNKKIAKVSKKGKVTAVKKGKCKIYARFSGKKLTCKVTVKNKKSQSSFDSKEDKQVTTEKKTTEKKQNTTEKKTTEVNTKPTEKTTEATKSDTTNPSENDSSKTEPHTHSYEKYVYRQPTCYLPGLYGYKCSCGSSYVDYNNLIQQLNHVYESEPYYVKQDTCTEWGYDLYHCTMCKGRVDEEVKKVMHGEGSTPGHNYQVTSDEILDGCTIEVVKETCSRCGDVVSSKSTFTEPKHDYQLLSHVDPHCANIGYNSYRCSRCGTNKMEYVPTSHLYHNLVAIVNSKYYDNTTNLEILQYTGNKNSEIYLYDENTVNTTSTRSSRIIYYCKDCHSIDESQMVANDGHWSDWRDREYHFTPDEVENIMATTPNMNK